MDQQTGRDVWKSIIKDHGELFATITGIATTQELSAGSWDCLLMTHKHFHPLTTGKVMALSYWMMLDVTGTRPSFKLAFLLDGGDTTAHMERTLAFDVVGSES